ncbi:uncharacterized protein J8A68_002936 [[Candida] subhashii]|uniref:Uncharacterized protein n=1 Tax=[Candida] subhashii TaxID=561895 RepID=A0A8J5QN45_9ASCO|nr:uncharacterized protein J8A68_002936 [[Candida] subhashii]KAG7663551.1 hypothetical protein J8A68_002936 [[Candida] subhashii]
MFVLRKPANMNAYDYSVFTQHPPDLEMQGGGLPPPIKESQIRAWESAERVSHNIIFGNNNINSSESEFEESEPENEDTNTNPIISIPGYTKGEINILVSSYKQTQQLPKHQYETHDPDREERKKLLEYKRKIMTKQERIYMQHQQLSTSNMGNKRKLQISQKKELLSRLFGYGNLLNLEYVTNNSHYSPIDSLSSVQRCMNEDKEEMSALIEENKAFIQIQEEMMQNFKGVTSSSDNNSMTSKYNTRRRNSQSIEDSTNNNEFDLDRVQEMMRRRLDRIYDRNINQYEGIITDSKDDEEYREFSFDSEDIIDHRMDEHGDEDLGNGDMDKELIEFTVGQLRKYIKQE